MAFQHRSTARLCSSAFHMGGTRSRVRICHDNSSAFMRPRIVRGSAKLVREASSACGMWANRPCSYIAWPASAAVSQRVRRPAVVRSHDENSDIPLAHVFSTISGQQHPCWRRGKPIHGTNRVSSSRQQGRHGHCRLRVTVESNKRSSSCNKAIASETG